MLKMERAESLPVLYIRVRNHYDVGFAIGTTFKGWIQDYMETSQDVKRFKNFNEGKEGQKLVDTYLSTGRESFPTYIAEIQGMADGSGVKFEDLFLLQISSELKFCHLNEGQVEEEVANASKGCTDVLVNGKQCRLIGHNDDWTADVFSRVYIVHVTIADENERVIEQFISFSYPGYLTGFCFGMNKSLIITLNSLTPKRANRSGVPVAILLRSLLACNSIEDCVSAMECKPLGSAYGMNINIAAIHGVNMCSMEVYPLKATSEVKVQYVPSGEESSDEKCYHFHQNHYKYISAEEVGPCTGSRLRDKRANEMPPPKTVSDVRVILGDTKDDVEPIYRTPSTSHYAPDVKTVATAIFSINEKLLYVNRSNSKLESSPCLTIPFF